MKYSSNMKNTSTAKTSTMGASSKGHIKSTGQSKGIVGGKKVKC